MVHKVCTFVYVATAAAAAAVCRSIATITYRLIKVRTLITFLSEPKITVATEKYDEAKRKNKKK